VDVLDREHDESSSNGAGSVRGLRGCETGGILVDVDHV
jgi:hypothetical protein